MSDNMSFLNKIGEKISSGATAISESARKFSETTRLNSKINRNLDEINNKYMIIGRLVKLNQMNNITDNEIIGYANEIDSLLAEVNELKEQINDLKGYKTCISCGAALDADVIFCSLCGVKQENKQNEIKKFIDVKSSKDDDFVEVDYTVDDYTAESQEETEVVEEQDDQSEPKPIIVDIETEKEQGEFIFCTECGNKEALGVNFCSNCGTKLN